MLNPGKITITHIALGTEQVADDNTNVCEDVQLLLILNANLIQVAEGDPELNGFI